MTQVDGVDPFSAFRTPAPQAAQSSSPVVQPAVPTNADSSDSFTKTGSGKQDNDQKIGFFRLLFKRLKQDQIDKINETGRLPKNAKFRQTSPDASGAFVIQNNIFHLTNGTRTLPTGYEVRKNKLGFTRVVPIDSEGFWLKKKENKDKI